MNWKKWISIAAAVCLAVTAVPMRAVAQEELLQEKMLEEIKEEIKEELKEEKEEQKEEKEELKEEKEELKEEKEEKEELQEQSDEKIEPQEESKKELLKGISLLMEGENSTAVSGNEAADFAGEGTEKNPYEIRNAEDLKLLAKNVNNGEKYEDKHFQLTADIDLENKEWTPIGTEDTLFQGTFDGYGYQIANLKISNGVEYAGLFGNVWGATIQNCNVTGEINGYNHTGGIVGYANNNTYILNCSFQGNVDTPTTKRKAVRILEKSRFVTAVFNIKANGKPILREINSANERACKLPFLFNIHLFPIGSGKGCNLIDIIFGNSFVVAVQEQLLFVMQGFNPLVDILCGNVADAFQRENQVFDFGINFGNPALKFLCSGIRILPMNEVIGGGMLN